MAHRAVYKTSIAEFLDDFYSGESRPLNEAFDDATALLQSQGSLSNTTRALEGRKALPVGSAQGFEELWLSPSSPHGGQIVDRVLRFGYQEAINLARARGVPIENFWVTGAGDDFEVHICEGAHHITVFIFVPAEGTRKYGSRRAQSRSWVVRAGDLTEVHADAPRATLDSDEPPIRRIQVSGPSPTPPAA